MAFTSSGFYRQLLAKPQWLENNFGWFEGYALFVPSHNNTIEASKRMGQFLKLVENKIFYDWSINCNPETVNNKCLVDTPTISLEFGH